MASPNISFDQIPASIRKPGKYLEFNTKLAVRSLPGNPQRVLLVGQRLASGTVAENEIIDVFDDVQAATYFGYGSIAHLMAKAAITSNPYVSLSVVAVDDAAAGVAATGKVTFTGTATAPGVVAVTVAGNRLDLAVDTGDTAANTASRLATLIAGTVDLPVTATASTGVVTLTAKHKGDAGNLLALTAWSKTTGISVAVTAFADGANDPSITPALTAAFAANHNIVVCPFATATALAELRAHLESVGSPMEQRDAIGVAGTSVSLSAGIALASAINSGLVTMGWHPGSVKSDAEIAASYAAVIASEEDPARPLNTLMMGYLDITPTAIQPGRTEQENALYNGLTPFEIGPGKRVQIVRAISTYTKNAEGVDDVALLDITTMRTLHYMRKAFRERISLRFPREKLSDRTADKVRSELLDVLFKAEELEIVEEVEANKSGLIVERDSQDVNRLNAKMPTDVVNGLHVFAGRVDLLL